MSLLMPWTFAERRRKNATLELSFFSWSRTFSAPFLWLQSLTKKGELGFGFVVVYFFMKINAPTKATAMITAIAAPTIVQV
jgi:hypothetical protein